jgi:hypothetical protein
VNKAEAYRANAVQARKRAEQIHDKDAKQVWLDIASQHDALADVAERNPDLMR